MSFAEIRRAAIRPYLWQAPPSVVYAVLTTAMALAIVLALIASIPLWTVGAFVALPFFVITAIWISGGAATAIMGAAAATPCRENVPANWAPASHTAILVAVCGEDAARVARYLAELSGNLVRVGLDGKTQIFVVSDTSGTAKVAAEEAAFRDLIETGMVSYRRRTENTGLKPGNIADWVDTHADNFNFMMVLDADSRMSAHRIRKMIWQMERRPALGLLQAGIGLVPGSTRFGHHQRVSARVLSRNYGRGLAAWSDDCGNYWGHNAIMRTAAFRVASKLPRLSGKAPFGGDLLSHDFIEAAWINRAGWSVALDPDPAGSAEAAPQTLAEFHRRDRRWCQGNLQHLRLLAAPGLLPISRIHLVSGVLSYLVAPAWLIIIALIASGTVSVSGGLALFLVVVVLALPKLCALADWLDRARTPWRRRIAVKAWAAEIALSTLVAPLIMLRQVGAVAAVCLGQDCGWKRQPMARFKLPKGAPEAAVGMALIGLFSGANGFAALWLLPVALPLCAAPLLVRALDAPV